jgi:cofilin
LLEFGLKRFFFLLRLHDLFIYIIYLFNPVIIYKMASSISPQAHLKTGGESSGGTNRASGCVDISASCGEHFQALKLRKKHRYLVFKIGETEIDVESVGARSATFEDFKKCMPENDCRFGVFDFEFKTSDGRPTSKLLFISWFPHNSTPYNKMAYASSKVKFRETLPGVDDRQAKTLKELDELIGKKDDEDDDQEMDL